MYSRIDGRGRPSSSWDLTERWDKREGEPDVDDIVNRDPGENPLSFVSEVGCAKFPEKLTPFQRVTFTCYPE